jgi:hypothetical protein
MSALSSLSSRYNEQYLHVAAQRAGVCFIKSFAVTTIVTGGNAAIGILIGACSACAAALHALVRPVFEVLLGERFSGELAELALSAFVNFFVATVMAPAFGVQLSIIGALAFSIIPRAIDYVLPHNSTTNFIFIP